VAPSPLLPLRQISFPSTQLFKDPRPRPSHWRGDWVGVPAAGPTAAASQPVVGECSGKAGGGDGARAAGAAGDGGGMGGADPCLFHLLRPHLYRAQVVVGLDTMQDTSSPRGDAGVEVYARIALLPTCDCDL
jgi:hypothetical protein